jgi:hypothetical protein
LRPGEHLVKPVRQLIELVSGALKGQLDLDLHGGRTSRDLTAIFRKRLAGQSPDSDASCASGHGMASALTRRRTADTQA